MAFLNQHHWDRYKRIVNTFINKDAGLQPFLWLHRIDQLSPYGEDSNISYVPVLLEGLFHFNYIKTWPANRQRDTVSGELDAGDQVLYISADILNKGGYLDKYGYWDFDWAEDRFIVNGKVFQPGGDTQVAQAGDEPLLFFVIMQRMPPEESKKVLNAYSGPELRIVNSRGIWLVDYKGNKVKDILNRPIHVEGEPVFILNR